MNVIIPAWNAARTLTATLNSLQEASPAVIVADANSPDGTATIATAAGAQVIQAPRGRGPQLVAGGAAATHEWLLFLHADTRLEPGWSKTVEAFTTGPPGAAHFTFALDHPGAEARRLERAVAWRCRRFALPYGDQGLLIHHSLYKAIGGYSPLPLMEDVDILRRLRPIKPSALPARAITAPDRFLRRGFYLRSIRNLTILSLYFAGVPPRILAKIY